MRRLYRVHGLKLEVTGSDGAKADVLESYLRPFAVEALDGLDYALKVTGAACGLPPPGVELIHDGEILPNVPAQVLRSENVRWYWIRDRLLIRIDSDQQRAEIHVSADCNHDLLVYCAIHLIDAGLGVVGQYLVHGAALALPNGSNQSLLLFAPSGYGKTTTALALALGGFVLMTDDAIVISSSDDTNRWNAWGLPRALKVHQRTADLLKPIAPLLTGKWDQYGEQVLTTDTLATIASVAPAERFDVAAIAILGDRTQGQHEIVALPKPQALRLLAEDNVNYAPGGVTPDHFAKFSALADLARAVPTIEIRVGQDLTTLASDALDAIAD